MLYSLGEFGRRYPTAVEKRTSKPMRDFSICDKPVNPAVRYTGIDGIFTDIGLGLSKAKQRIVWGAAKDLYVNHRYEIVSNAFNYVNLEQLLRYPQLHGETIPSLSALKSSFDVTERISRIKEPANGCIVLEFLMVSKYTTMQGDKIKIRVPVKLWYTPDVRWAVLPPEFVIGDDKT